MGVLDEIVAHKREEVAARRAARPLAGLEAACRSLLPARELAEALTPGAGRRVRLIAEVKKASPSKGVLAADLDVAAQARAYAAAGADAVSVLTDARWFKGSLDDLVAVRAAVTRPLLRKDFTVDEYQLWEARAAGADAALLIVAALERTALRDLFQAAKGIGVHTLVEAHTAAELEEALALGARVLGVNNRNLQTLETDLATSLRLLPLVPPGHVAVAESGIFTRDDVERVARAGAQAVLVGEALVRAADVAAKVRELTLEPPHPSLSPRGGEDR
jgi:indole-3-glycerol phosphate synthase